jgi:hypothetical protein
MPGGQIQSVQSGEAAHLALVEITLTFENVSLPMHPRAKDPTNVGRNGLLARANY